MTFKTAILQTPSTKRDNKNNIKTLISNKEALTDDAGRKSVARLSLLKIQTTSNFCY